MKNATATSHGSSLLTASLGAADGAGAEAGPDIDFMMQDTAACHRAVAGQAIDCFATGGRFVVGPSRCHFLS
jgi:hypothetical protein